MERTVLELIEERADGIGTHGSKMLFEKKSTRMRDSSKSFPSHSRQPAHYVHVHLRGPIWSYLLLMYSMISERSHSTGESENLS